MRSIQSIKGSSCAISFGFVLCLAVANLTSLNLVGAFRSLSMTVAISSKKNSLEDLTSKVTSVTASSKVEVLNPIQFGIKVVQSNEGQDATGVLLSGVSKLISAILEQGKIHKVEIPSGFDYRTGESKTRVVNFGLKELTDTGLFAATEVIDVGKRLYLGGKRPESKFRLSLPKGTKNGALDPITFTLKVVQSKDGKEAADVLVGGGLKLVGAILEEGKKCQVEVPKGFDYRTRKIVTKAVSVGPAGLIDLGLFAGSELFEVYKRLYFGEADESQANVYEVAEKRNIKTGELVLPKQQRYIVNVNGKRVLVARNV